MSVFDSSKRQAGISQLFQRFVFSFLIFLGVVLLAQTVVHADEVTGVTASFSESAKIAQAESTTEKAQSPGTTSPKKTKSIGSGKSFPHDKKVARSGKVAPGPLPDNLKDVVAYAISNHPQVAVARARLGEAKAGIIVAEANNGLQLEGSLGHGYGAQSTTSIPLGNEIFQQPNLGNGKRYVLSLTGKKLLYDFGTTEKNISRAMKLASAEEFNLAVRINDIGQAMAQAYLNVVETRDLSRLNNDNITALEEIQKLVELNQTNGNGTVADVKRVEARLVDARAVATDNEAELQNALDRFQRLVKAEPGNLKPVPDLADYTPAKVESAIALLPQTSPRIRADEMARRATELEIESKKSSLLPQVIFQTDSTLKSYTGAYWNNFDAQAMVSMTYKFADGGLSQGQIGQILARLEQDEQRFNFDRDESEADLRKFYITIASARSKTASLADGVEASRKARGLYKEQFQGGKRTLFELLDIQTAAFNAERASIMNMFEERRAVYGVLSTLGVFVEAVNGQRNAMVAEETKNTKQANKANTP
jgi:outer membrane protein TolC